MFPDDSKRRAGEKAAADIDEGLDMAASPAQREAVILHHREWSEIEATEKARAEREARLKEAAEVDRVARYIRGPTAFSA